MQLQYVSLCALNYNLHKCGCRKTVLCRSISLYIIYLTELHCIYIPLNGSAHYFPLRSTGDEDDFTMETFRFYIFHHPKRAPVLQANISIPQYHSSIHRRILRIRNRYAFSGGLAPCLPYRNTPAIPRTTSCLQQDETHRALNFLIRVLSANRKLKFFKLANWISVYVYISWCCTDDS